MDFNVSFSRRKREYNIDMALTLIANSTVVGIIVLVAVVAITAAVCIYLLSLKEKGNK